VIAARQDAVAAANEGLFAGHLLAGQISEELGQFAEAEASYRAAMQAAPADDEVSIRSRIALARVLLKQQSEAAPALRPAQPPRSTSQMPTERDREQTALRVLNALLTLTLQPVLPTDKTPTSSEADKLADEILALGDKAPFDARAQALAVKGLHTRALQVYVTGLRDKRVLAPEYANSLLELVNGHPTLKRPESLTPPNPLRAEQFYANGVRAFFAGKFQLAEEQFLAAIENDNGDARSHYYLGLARLAQGKREGQEDLDAGSRLEAQGHPDRAAVSAAFERVQGSLRKVLNQARTRP
jgi:tetratricopeptide (TPR) repeat protein